MSSQSFSALSLIWRGLSRHRDWQQQWRKPDPKPRYDAIIVGGGGHGHRAAYYLAKEHGLTNIAVLEKGWIGGGNTGRNTTIIRSNYLFNESAALYDHSVKLWENLSQVLNYNVMFSPRGVMMLAHTVHDVQVFKRHVHANRCNGVDNEWLEPSQAKEFCPPLNIEDNIRYPVLGAALQRRGGTARHDAVAWGYARAADALGVDIIENCEVTGIRRDSRGAVEALETTRGVIQSPKVESPPPATPAWSWRWPVCICPWRVIRCRPWYPSRSNRSSPAWSCRTPSMPTSASRTRVNWSSAPVPTPIPRIPSAAPCMSTRTLWMPFANCSPIFAGCA